jgi:hypothetical protein
LEKVSTSLLSPRGHIVPLDKHGENKLEEEAVDDFLNSHLTRTGQIYYINVFKNIFIYYLPITHYWTGLLILLDHSYLVGNLTK